jgi:uncharacterized protein (TIGR02145 family)
MDEDIEIVYGEDLIDGRDNKTYKTVKIGSQTWMAKNLDFRGGSDNLGLCYGDELGGDKNNSCAKYGRLYDWATAMALDATKNSESFMVSGNYKGICPDDWHIPSSTEGNALLEYVGKASGTKLKSKDDSWINNGIGTDDFGFAALPAGRYRDYDGIGFDLKGEDTRWWTTKEEDNKKSLALWVGHNNNEANHSPYLKVDFHSVRCVKD